MPLKRRASSRTRASTRSTKGRVPPGKVRSSTKKTLAKKHVSRSRGRSAKPVISRQTVEHVAAVARLQLTDAEITRFAGDLNGILAAFRDLDSVPIKDVEPTFHPVPLENVLREDVIERCFTPDEALGNTVHKERGFFKGPRAV